MISGFITASGILIATSQMKHILGIKAEGDTLPLSAGRDMWKGSAGSIPIRW